MRRIGKLLAVATVRVCCDGSPPPSPQRAGRTLLRLTRGQRRPDGSTLRYLAPNAKSVVADRRARRQAAPADARRQRRVERHHRPARARHLHLRLQRRRRHGTRPVEQQHQIRLRPLRRRQRRPGAGRRAAVLRRQAGTARRGAHPALHLEDARGQPDRVGLHAAGIRQGQQLSRPLPPPRRRRHRVGLDDDRAGEQHHRQRHCRGQGEADGRRDAARPRHPELSGPAPRSRYRTR